MGGMGPGSPPLNPALIVHLCLIWCRVVRSRNVSPHNFDGLAMSVLAISVAPFFQRTSVQEKLIIENKLGLNFSVTFVPI